MYGGFRIGSLRITDSVFTQVITVTITDFIAYLLVSLIARRMMNPLPLLATLPVVVIITLLWSVYIHRNFARLFPPKKMIIVYANKSARSLVYKMSKRYDKFIICAAINTNEGFERISKELTNFDAVVICDTENQLRNDILKFCFEHKIVTYVTPKISDIIIRGSEELHILDTPLLVSRNFGAKLEQRIIKRAFDIVVSFVAIIVLSPLFLATAIAVKAYDGGPAIYKQKRLTYGGKEFYLYKFRSMITDAEKDGKARLAAQGDSRITPVGAFIRKTRLDELPQLINIIRGDMSFIGPRPLLVEYLPLYTPEQMRRHEVRPGISGLAQVNGRNAISWEEKFRLDVEYVDTVSLKTDIHIFFKTIANVLKQDGINSAENNTMEKFTGAKEEVKR